MSSITYETVHAAHSSTKSPADKPKGLLARLFGRLIAYREHQALIELRRHQILLPHELERAGWKIDERSEDSLPFVR